MSSMFFWAACFLSAATFCVHVFLGRGGYVKPMLADNNTPEIIKTLSYVSWHAASVGFFSYVLALAWAALDPRAYAAAVVIAFMAAATALMFFALALRGYTLTARLPGGYLSAGIAILSACGLYSA